MRVCPECETVLDDVDSACPECGWERRDVAGIADFLTRSERTDQLECSYRENYEELAVKNLARSNIDRRFLRHQAIRVLRYLGDVKGLTACDLGIGQGLLTRELLGAGVRRVTAVDVSPSYLAALAGEARIEPVLANAERLPFRDEFDVLVSTDVMEHVLNVGSFLYCVNRALKPGAIACIRVPYREPLLAYSPHLGYPHRFGHLRSFDANILRRYMVEAGFSVDKIHLDGFSLGSPQPYLYDRVWKKRLYNRFVAAVRRRIADETAVALWRGPLVRWIMRPVEMVVVARKTRGLKGVAV